MPWVIAVVIGCAVITLVDLMMSGGSKRERDWGDLSMQEKAEWSRAADAAVRAGHARQKAKPWMRIHETNESADQWIEVGKGEGA